LPVVLPKDVDVTVSGRTVEVKGPKGTLSRQVHPDMRVAVADRQLTVSRPTDQRQHRALHGLTRALIANMVKGVVDGFRINLEIQGVGYRATKQGRQVTFQVGYSHPVEITPPPGVEIEVPQPNRIGIVGTDKEQVGQLADRADNFCCASLLGLPAKVHAEQLALGMADIRDALRALYIEATGDDPWTDE